MSYTIPTAVQPAVRRVQQQMLDLGFRIGARAPDGKPGKDTWPQLGDALTELATLRSEALPVQSVQSVSENPLTAHDIRDVPLRFTGSLQVLRPSQIRHVIVHHSVNANPKWGVRECHLSHQSRGFIGIGYALYVEQDGTIYWGRADAGNDYRGAHCKAGGANGFSVGVCLDGDYTTEPPSDFLLDRCAAAVGFLLHRNGLTASATRYHDDFVTSRNCPGAAFPKRSAFIKRVKRFI